MQIYHLYQLLPALSKKELGHFRSFLKKYGSQGERLLPLYDYLRKFYPHLAGEQRLDPDAIFSHLYPAAKMENRKLILNQLSELHGLLHDFLLVQKLQEDDRRAAYLKLEILGERAQTDAYQRKSAQLLKELEEDPAPSWHDLLLKVRVYEDQLIRELPATYAEGAAMLRQLLADLDEAYMAARYKFMTGLAKYKQFLDAPDPDPVPQLPAANGKLSGAYQLCYQLEQHKQESDFYKLDQLLRSEDRLAISIADQYEILTTLINYAAHQIRIGRETYLRIALDLYQFGLIERILLQGRGLTVAKFSNIVSLGCLLQEFDWTLEFIERYESFLPETERYQQKILSKAIVCLEQGNYQDCLATLQKAFFTDPVYSLRARALSLRALYDHPEMDEEEILQSCRNFRSFLKSHRSVKGKNKDAAIHLISMIRALVKRDKSQNDLEIQLQGLHPIFYKKWLLSKLASYTKR